MNKVISLKDAVSQLINDGDYLAFGGFTTNRKPYAVVHEMIRQGKKNLYVESGPAGGDMDMLIGVGACTAYINSYTANSGYSNVGRRFRKAIENGDMLFEDYSLDVQPILYHAGSLGLPYVPVKHMLGSDLADKWGISEEIRKQHDKLPNKKLIKSQNPFNPEETLCLVPTPDIDVAVIHVQKASTEGVIRIEGSTIIDVDIALSAKRCIVTCEELVEPEEMMQNSEMNQIPSFIVDAVVHVPYGAHPSQVYNYYDYDRAFLQLYDKVSKDDEAFHAFIKEWILDVPTHEAYIEKLGVNRLVALSVRKGLGYSVKEKS